MNKLLSMALSGSLALSALLASCGPQPPASSQGTKPKPVYEVPKEQLAEEAAEAEGKKVQKKAAATTAAAPSSLKPSAPAGGLAPAGKGISSEKKSQELTSDFKGSVAKDGSTGIKSDAKTTSAPATPAPAASSGTKDADRGAFTGVATPGTVESVTSYATGETSLKVKKNVEQKLKNINSAHNKDMEKALKDQ